jgi:adenylosuccinate lyase
LLLALVNQGLSRDAAYRLTQRAAMRVWEEGGTFKERVLADPDIGQHLSRGELEQLFDLKHHLRHVEELFRRVFAK